MSKMSVKTIDNAQRILVLGSSSSYRRTLLERLGLPFEVAAPNIDERVTARESLASAAQRLAEAKACAVAVAYRNALVIGCDQIANCEGAPLGKPVTRERAIAQLTQMSGRTVVFHTALALVDSASGRCGRRLVDVSSTFRRLTRDEIVAYVDREQPFDCAGSVRSEALGIALFEKITSDDPTALIGLPLIALTELLRAEGVAVLLRNSGFAPARNTLS